jgi:flagellar hook-associated protein 2
LTATGLSGGTLNEGKNLLYTINGGSTQIESTTNTIDDTSSGIANLTVTALDTGTTKISIGSDTSTISSAIEQFVSDYNSLQTYISTEQELSTASSGSNIPGTLTGDSESSEIANQLRSIVNGVENITGTSGAVTQLADLGFESNGANNLISLTSSSALTSMLQEHLSDVAALFSDTTNGMATLMSSFITSTLSSDGSLTARTDNLTTQQSSIQTQISNLEIKITNDSNEWDSEFQAMETAESKANSELTYISQEVSSGSL